MAEGGATHGVEKRKGVYQFAYKRSADQDAAGPVRRPVVIVGAGPVGLSLAIDLAEKDVPVVILDDADRIGEGSRAICFAKRTLEIWDRLGVGDKMIDKGVTWKLGKCFHENDLAYQFDLLPEEGHRMPAFINLQQYYVEQYLVERALDLPQIDLRWLNKAVKVAPHADGVVVTIETPDGPYEIDAEWLLACDGAKSPIRDMLGEGFKGHVFEDRFLIADVKMAADFPAERWFWFDPPFHPGQSALLHKQPDDVWRIDLQLGWDADPEKEKQPERVVPRIEQMLGHSNFDLEWVSVYTFQCRRIDNFVHGRIVFAGDAAHQVSPFGARGANSGVQDAENLAWKLALVLKGEAPESLIETYNLERSAAADENIGHSTRSTDFIAPRSAFERRLRNAVLDLARTAPFARVMVNSGRLSMPSVYDTELSTEDQDVFAGSARLGGPLPDCPMQTADHRDTHLLNELGDGFTVLYARDGGRPNSVEGATLKVIGDDLLDSEGLFKRRLDATPGSTYVVRPDQHLAARFRTFDAGKVKHAIDRACGRA
ncbi:FAD-dependent oxidoreductase [Amorphus orientalis]|uniref:3-(3-hydroxy-phenyl)propionate hydroxylase n=1 Tax=Amorphus orientalis TaxID=649198 RepID=A0AAE3VPY8_9HYPH|nr:FAD-dependent oxidoreductase [Amorphus orientalis]MDQ0315952.1 3-(3-hydroxy-phenyl)propionate hydroxylase [Amorphus orientalis]